MAEPFSVLMVIENYLPWVGGTERQLATLAAGLGAQRIRVEVLTAQRSPAWPLSEEIAGTRVHRLPYPKVWLLGVLVLLFRTAMFLLTHGRHFSVFHVHTVSVLAMVTVVVGRILRKAVILKAVGGWELEHGVLNPARRRRVFYRWILAILRRADVWVAISRHLRHAMEEAGVRPERIVTIPNGVDTARFAPQPRGEGWEERADSAPQVIFVGRLVEEKGLPVLLEAWAIVVRRVPGAILNIVGEGPLEEALKALVQRLGIMSSVRFHGHQETVIPFLQAAALFVLPSYVEGLSNTLLEAMAMELPVVATRISGSEDVVDDGVTGLLVPPGDVPALAQALGALLKDTGHTGAMGRQARKRVIQLCSLEQVTHAYLQLYQDIAKDGARLCAESPVS